MLNEDCTFLDMKLKYVIGSVLLIVLGFFLFTLYKAGSFKSINPHSEGEILGYIEDLQGPEDLDISYLNNILFISSTDRRDTSRQGAIYALDLDGVADPQLLIHDYQDSFHPHGISVFEQDSATYLHVVNHNNNGDFIEFFELKNDSLFHFKSVESSLMCCPNDVLAIAPDQCYITNDHGNKSGFMRTLEDYLTLPMSGILYYDGKEISEAFTGMSYANGINISRDGNYIYATETTGRKMLTFEVSEDGSLTKKNELSLQSGLDNIDVDLDGNIWIGSHPKLLAFVSHAKDKTVPSPSQVFKITPGKEDHLAYDVKEIYLNDGKELSGSSVALYHENTLYIGVVFEPTILMLEMK